MTTRELKATLEGYYDELPAEYALADLFFKGKVNFLDAMKAYTYALEKERHIQNCRFCEAAVSLTQILGGNYKGKSKEEILKRAVHTYNLNLNLVPGIHDEKYHYTEEDKKFWDEFCNSIYGVDLDLRIKEEEK